MTLYELDIAAAWLSIINATMVCALFSALGPHKRHWFTLPLYVRLGMLPVIVFFAKRGADLHSIAGDTSVIGGHASWPTVWAGLALAYFFASCCAFVTANTLPVEFLARMQRVFDRARCAPRKSVLDAPADLTVRDSLALIRGGAAGGLPPVVYPPVAGGWTDAPSRDAEPHHPDAVVRA